MFGNLWSNFGASKTSLTAEACCGNRTKKDVNGAQPITVVHQVSGGSVDDTATSDFVADSQHTSFADDTAFAHKLESYEDAQLETLKENGVPAVDTSESESDQDTLRTASKALQEEAMNAKKILRQEMKTVGGDIGVTQQHFDDLCSNWAHHGMSFFGSPKSHKAVDQRVDQTNNFPKMPLVPDPEYGRAGTIPKGLFKTSISSVSQGDVEMHQTSSAEVDSEDDDEDVEEVLNRHYGQEIRNVPPRHKAAKKSPLRKGIDNLRDRMEKQGIDEPLSESEEEGEKMKTRTLELCFITPGNEDGVAEPRRKEITFRRKPLGIKWEKRLPIEITNVNEDSHAQEQGVQIGWKLTAINGATNRVDCKTLKNYGQAHKALMDEVNKLPGALPTKKTAVPKALLSHVCTVMICTASGFDKEYQDSHKDISIFVVCWASHGHTDKHHSKVKTHTQPLDTEFSIEWQQEFHLFDYALEDNIEFAMYEKKGEERLLGRGTVKYHAFQHMMDHDVRRSGKWLGFTPTLYDPITEHPKNIELKVQLRLDLLPEKEFEMNTYRGLMREKLLALGVHEREVDHLLENTKGQTTAAGIVKAGLLAYHQHSESIGRIHPFPGERKHSTEDVSQLDEEDLHKLREYQLRLDENIATSDPNRLWIQQNIVLPGKIEGKKDIVIHFRTGPPRHDIEKLRFTERPIGIVFSERVPIRVYKVKEHSEALARGVKKGWTIEGIDAKTMPDTTYEEAAKLLYGELKRLPERRKSKMEPRAPSGHSSRAPSEI